MADEIKRANVRATSWKIALEGAVDHMNQALVKLRDLRKRADELKMPKLVEELDDIIELLE